MSRATSIDFSVTKTAHKAITVSWSYKDGATTYTSPSHLKSQTIIIDSQGPGVEGVVKAINLYDITARSYVITDVTPGVILSAPFSVKLVAGMDNAGAYTRNQLASATLLSQQLVNLVPTPAMTISGTDKGIKFEVTSGATMPADVSYAEVVLSSSSSDGLLTATVYKSDVSGNVFTVGFSNIYGDTLELINGASYEVSVRYYTEVNGYGDWLSVESVVPSAVFSAPRNVTVVRPSGADADNGAVLISWQSPENDVNPAVGNTSTFVDHYEVWYKAASSAVSAPSSFDVSGHPEGWTAISGGSSANGRIATTSSETQGAGSYSHKQTGLEAGKLYWFVVRAARATEDGEVDNIAPTTDNELLGAFSAPVDGLVFNYNAVSAPTMTASTAINQQYLNYNIAYPDNATKFNAGNVADLAAAQYSSRYVVKYAPVANGSSGSVEGGYTADATGAAVSAISISYTSPAGPGMVISYGTTNYVYYVVFEQTYKGTVYTSADSGASSLINGAANKMLTTYQTLPAPTAFSSTALNGDNTPLSVGKTDGDGRLKASWTGVSAAGYDNSRFHAGIYYRISGGAVANPDLHDASGVSENVTGSNGTNALGVAVGTTTVLGLNNGTAYHLKVQSYFYNDEMNVWVYSAETTLANNASGVIGNVPFYYADAVVANSATPVLSNGNSNITFTWDVPAGLNGITETPEVSAAYQYTFNKNNEDPSIHQVDTASSSLHNFALGSGFHVDVQSAYKTLGGAYMTNASAYVIYYAVPNAPSVGLTAADTSLNAVYAQGSNDAVLAFQKYNVELRGGAGAVAAHDVTASSELFTGLTNGTQYLVDIYAVYSYGSQMWNSAVTTSATDENGIPFGVPIFNSTSFSVGSKQFSFTVNPNGRSLREYLLVGIPQDTAGNYDESIEVLQNSSWSAGANNAVAVTINSSNLGTFNYNLKEVLIVVENESGTAVKYPPTNA